MGYCGAVRSGCAHVVCGTLLLVSVPLWAQSAADSSLVIATDRPSVTNSSTVVPEGGFQLENGLLATNSDRRSTLDFPESNIRYGLFEKTELRIALPDYFQNLPPGGASGFGDAAFGVKQQLGPVSGFDVSLIAFLSVPSGAQGVSSHGYDPGLQLPWSRKLSDEWTVEGQLAFYWPTAEGQRNSTGEATLLLDRQLSERCDAFVEYAADVPNRGGSRQLLHVGSAYRFAPHHQVDFHVAAGLTDASPKSLVGFGYSYLFLTK
jgi:hypothetical protein